MQYHLSILARAKGELDQAEANLNQALEAQKTKGSTKTLLYASCLYKLGSIAKQRGNAEQSKYVDSHSAIMGTRYP